MQVSQYKWCLLRGCGQLESDLIMNLIDSLLDYIMTKFD